METIDFPDGKRTLVDADIVDRAVEVADVVTIVIADGNGARLQGLDGTTTVRSLDAVNIDLAAGAAADGGEVVPLAVVDRRGGGQRKLIGAAAIDQEIHRTA